MSKDSKKITDSIQQDHARFLNILKGRIKKGFKDYISHHHLIGKKGSKLVSIPIPRIEIPRFVFGTPETGVGQGPGKEGDAISEETNKSNESGQAGNMPGQHMMEVDVTLEELSDFLGEELELPRLSAKQHGQLSSENTRYSSIAPTGPHSLRNFKHTFKQALKRQISTGTYDPENPVVVPIRRDFRFRHPETILKPEFNAVVLYMMDISGSMGSEQKDIVRTAAFWIDLWVNQHYKNIKKRFIVHDSSAKEVNQETFFRLKESGGTLISSAYRLCAEIVERDYPSSEWNVYCFHFSDGDNWSQDDTQICINIMQTRIMPRSNLFAYGQVESRYGSGQFYRDLEKHLDREGQIVLSKIEDRGAIPDCLKRFFGKR